MSKQTSASSSDMVKINWVIDSMIQFRRSLFDAVMLYSLNIRLLWTFKSEKNASRSDNNSDLSLVPRQVGDGVQNDQPGIDDADTPIENESNGEDDIQSQPLVQEGSPIPLRKITIIKYPSVRLSED